MTEQKKKRITKLHNKKYPKGTHVCATHVEHPEYGVGTTITEHHAAPDEYGDIDWYDVKFEHGIVEKVSTDDLHIILEVVHENHEHHEEEITESCGCNNGNESIDMESIVRDRIIDLLNEQFGSIRQSFGVGPRKELPQRMPTIRGTVGQADASRRGTKPPAGKVPERIKYPTGYESSATYTDLSRGIDRVSSGTSGVIPKEIAAKRRFDSSYEGQLPGGKVDYAFIGQKARRTGARMGRGGYPSSTVRGNVGPNVHFDSRLHASGAPAAYRKALKAGTVTPEMRTAERARRAAVRRERAAEYRNR